MFVLIWEREEPPSNMHDVRAIAAPLALKLKWTTLFSHRFLAGKHINLLELESLIGLLRRITRAGIRAKRLLVLVDSRVVLEPSQKAARAHEQSISCFENCGFGASLVTSPWNWCGSLPGQIQPMPLRGTSRSQAGMPLCQSFLLRRPQCWHQLPLSRS